MATSGNPPHDSPSRAADGKPSAPRRIPGLRFPWIIAFGFLVATGLLAVVVGMAYRETKRQIQSSEWVLHSRDVLAAITDYGNALKSASNAASDYYTNGNESDVPAYAAAATAIHTALEHIRQITVDNPTQTELVTQLSTTTDQALVMLSQVMDLHRQGKKGTEPLADLTKSSKGMTASLNKTWAALSAEENNLLKERSAEQAAASRKALRLELWGGLLAGLLMLSALILFLRESSGRLRAQHELANANVDLEQRVRDRIAEVQYVNQLLTIENKNRISAEEKIRQLNTDLERRVVERTSQLQAANQELEAFCYSVSHDLRAPLRHIDGFTKILVEDFSAGMDPEALHCLNRIQVAISNMGHLVDDLLNLSRVSRKGLTLQNVDLGDLVREVRAEFAPDLSGRNLHWEIGELPIVLGDPNLLKQVFVNLLANSVKFTRRRDSATIQVAQKSADSETVIFVRDNGVGFNMKYADKLFGVFQRLHTPEEFEGTGVGLATVQRIIQKHGGRVWAESEPDHGACFFFTVGVPSASLADTQSAGERIVS
jgi:signal transduction histidine kinase